MALIASKLNSLRICPLKIQNNVVVHYSKFFHGKEYKKCFKTLEIDERSDQEQIRIAYLQLVKRFRPDSGTEEANADKFHEIDNAFRTLMHRKSKEVDVVDEAIVQEQDIKHTAPQHRQYLSYGGVGSGNPYQREKQYTKMRAMQASENLYNHRMGKVSAGEHALMDKMPLKHKIKTKYGFDRLVEDLIQESMSRGEFSNLKNSGKPLPDHQNRNPYVDFTTHKLNEVLIENGFTPEWILLQKEIREEATSLRKSLFSERQYFGSYPLSVEDNIEWSEKVYNYKQVVDQLNKKIAKFNLVVPVLNKQMIQISLEREAQRVMVIGKGYEDLRHSDQRPTKYKKELKQPAANSINIFGLLEYMFKTK
uniref:J domain-containing protein n=1 Tax=Dendroctonus ponderosae TaxID=77166 RepID=J3JZB0_DENPD|nr:unknown [Dendroctonus ponderosae]